MVSCRAAFCAWTFWREFPPMVSCWVAFLHDNSNRNFLPMMCCLAVFAHEHSREDSSQWCVVKLFLYMDILQRVPLNGGLLSCSYTWTFKRRFHLMVSYWAVLIHEHSKEDSTQWWVVDYTWTFKKGFQSMMIC